MREANETTSRCFWHSANSRHVLCRSKASQVCLCLFVPLWQWEAQHRHLGVPRKHSARQQPPRRDGSCPPPMEPRIGPTPFRRLPLTCSRTAPPSRSTLSARPSSSPARHAQRRTAGPAGGSAPLRRGRWPAWAAENNLSGGAGGQGGAVSAAVCAEPAKWARLQQRQVRAALRFACCGGCSRVRRARVLDRFSLAPNTHRDAKKGCSVSDEAT